MSGLLCKLLEPLRLYVKILSLACGITTRCQSRHVYLYHSIELVDIYTMIKMYARKVDYVHGK